MHLPNVDTPPHGLSSGPDRLTSGQEIPSLNWPMLPLASLVIWLESYGNLFLYM